MESAAERQRRYRLHHKGDHSLCKPERDCRAHETASMAIDEDATIPTVTTRGTKLIRDLRDGLSPETMLLLEEAARIADRLDRLDDILIGKHRQWMHFRTREDGGINVVLTGALAEARQQAATLAGLIRDIRTVKNAAKAGAGTDDKRGASLFDDDNERDELASRRAGRGTKPAN